MNENEPSSTPIRYNTLTGQDLKSLKKQLLKQAYDRQIYIKQQHLLANPEKQPRRLSQPRLFSSNSVQVLPSYQYQIKPSFKELLKDSYEADIQRRLLKKQEEKKSIREQQDVLTQLQKHQMQYQERRRKDREEYAQFLSSEINRKKEQKVQLRRQQSIKQQERISRKKGQLNKQQSFKEYFSKVDQFRDIVSSDYLKYVNEQRKLSQERVAYDSINNEKQRRLLEEQASEERRKNQQKKQELRAALEQQIIENRSWRSNQLNSFKNRGYVKSELNLYNPISNPIDYQLDTNNKYLMRQLLQKQIFPPLGPSSTE